MNQLVQPQKNDSCKITALKLLITLGWLYINPHDCLQKRGSNRELILKDELMNQLKKRRFEYKGKQYPLSDSAMHQILRQITNPGLNEGLLIANERLYDKLCLGITITEFIDGKKHQPTITLIDWHNINNNCFHVTERLEVLSSNSSHICHPDIVCYVNGIPLVVIETKCMDQSETSTKLLDQAISKMLRQQKNDEIPQLFSYAQLLVACSSTKARYGTTQTMAKFWAAWREELFSNELINTLNNKTLNNRDFSALFANRETKHAHYFAKLWSKPQRATEQDKLLISLLSPERLLEFIHFFVLFDKKVNKIVARYPQVFAIKALLKRITQRNATGGREGGVIWHTTGSGKSFTMVFLTKVLLLQQSLKNCRIVVVTDRIDLEKQLARTFLSSGAFGSAIFSRKQGENARALSGKELAQRIGQGADRIIFSIINKFSSASKLAECYNPSADLIVLVDEGHRSQNRENHERMRKALPNAAYIAFTGTPLLKDEKTVNRFGPILHAYTMQQAVQDETITALLYEQRKPELELNEKAIDNWFEKITINLTKSQKAALKEKFSRKHRVYACEKRIELIAWDIAAHFSHYIKPLGNGLKGQLATDSKLSAIRYKKYLDATGLVTSAVVISFPDNHTDHKNKNDSTLAELQQWWKQNIGSQAEEKYTQQVLTAFSSDNDPDLIIVANKLLTGFDEPRNCVLYIDKPLQQHSLIQAIARVNRLHQAKQYGLLIDYRGILEQLDTAISDYQHLSDHTQGGYAVEDIMGLYTSMSTEYKRLPDLHKVLLSLFKDLDKSRSLEQYRQILLPHWQTNQQQDSFDSRQKIREKFYETLNKFELCLQIALSSTSFFNDDTIREHTISQYKNDLHFFSNLRNIAQQDAQQTSDYSAYNEQMHNLLDTHLIGNQVYGKNTVYRVAESDTQQDDNNWTIDKTRNEMNIIRGRLKKTIEQDFYNDPYAKKVFSELLKDVIRQAEALFDQPVKQYALFKCFEQEVHQRDLNNIPESLSDNHHARAYYGCFRLVLGDEYFSQLNETEITQFVKQALSISNIVNKAIAENSINPLNIDTDIRKNLLPELFSSFGMDKTKAIIEQVIVIAQYIITNKTTI